MTYNLGSVALIPLGEGRMFAAGDVTIAVFRTRDGQVYATEPWCPHRGGPLADGIVATDRVLCPLHGYAFKLTTGCAIRHECGSIETYPIRVTGDGHLLVTIRPQTASRDDGDGARRSIDPTQSSDVVHADA
jgi:nitrite reductase (NADH) small subunit